MAGRNAGGPETYEHGLVRNLVKLDQNNEYRILCFNQSAADSFGIFAPNVKFCPLPNRSRVLSMMLDLPAKIKTENVELLHAAYVPPMFSPADYISTLHCSSIFIHPEYYPIPIRLRLKYLIRRGMRNAKHIICVSKNVLELASDYYGVSKEKMSVIYNGVGTHFRPISEAERRTVLSSYGISGRYLLFVGRIEQRKNILRVLHAFNIFRHEIDPRFKLVLAGEKTWARLSLEKTIRGLNLTSHIIHTGHIKNEDLPSLYSGAELLVFPSLWEGFGIPVIEAMACGTPVLTSNLSSLPEISGGASLLVDPYSIDEIVHGIEKVTKNKVFRDRMKQKGLDRAKDFSWEKTAKETLEIYKQFS